MRTFAFQTSNDNGSFSVKAVCLSDDSKVEELEIDAAAENSPEEVPTAVEAA